jgi:hypothetical protein
VTTARALSWCFVGASRTSRTSIRMNEDVGASKGSDLGSSSSDDMPRSGMFEVTGAMLAK